MTKRLSALIFDDETPVMLGGLTLTERAVLLAHRAGFSPVRVWGRRALDSRSIAELRSRDAAVVQQQSAGSSPLEDVRTDEGVVVVGSNVLFAPAVLDGLIGSTGVDDGVPATAACSDGAPLLLYVPAGAAVGLQRCRSLQTMVASLADRTIFRALPLETTFCRRVNPGVRALAVEHDYVRHLNGGESESFFTKNIRRFSVPLTSRLVRLGARPTHVTLGGLALAVASAWCLARGSYGAGVLGAVLYYASMIFDCSDGEVARLTVRDSPSGAWLETMVDYLTYFLVLAALTIAIGDRPDAQSYRIASATALLGSVVVALVASYLRHRVAAADPGQFDDASAHAMASATTFHRFASWGRQWIKRSTLAHLIVALALVNQLPVLLYLWAFGATVAGFVIVAVEPFVVRRVAVAPPGVRHAGIDG